MATAFHPKERPGPLLRNVLTRNAEEAHSRQSGRSHAPSNANPVDWEEYKNRVEAIATAAKTRENSRQVGRGRAEEKKHQARLEAMEKWREYMLQDSRKYSLHSRHLRPNLDDLLARVED